jgi:ABC-type lipoprotein export system ATPase subunit
MVTHSPECAGYAKRIMRIADGKLVGDHSNLKSFDHRLLTLDIQTHRKNRARGPANHTIRS